MQRTVVTNPDVLGHALRDVINTYTREVLIGHSLIGDEQIDILDGDNIRQEINAIIIYFVEKWKSCEMEDGSGTRIDAPHETPS